jgi:tetratricopeptide (TPR) repeat protein
MAYGSAALQENAFMPRSQMWQPAYDAMRDRFILLVLFSVLALAPLAPLPASSANNPATSAASVPASAAGDTSENPMKARELVDAAINMTDSERAVKLLWQATTMDPTLEEAYLYLGLFYNSRSNFGKVVEVYQRLVKYEPRLVTAYLNIGEAYMSFSPPKFNDALPYYRKALEIDPTSSFAELRIGEIYAQQGNKSEAVKYLRLASGDRTKNPGVAAEADRILHEIGAS